MAGFVDFRKLNFRAISTNVIASIQLEGAIGFSKVEVVEPRQIKLAVGEMIH
jgi:hypothetical protein